ncbi:MAG: acetylxylan esterase [Balneolaceae bacterium]|nr:acetylxylan esterase [Balneolaceae bacterium]MBO6547839.1 acetylxylan esterase [Balneolaceae bacterium]MBO6648350.1 acetylxylan esterase [Balneolaceae bacterium]
MKPVIKHLSLIILLGLFLIKVNAQQITEHIVLESDGWEIKGVLTLPEDQSGNIPLVIMTHTMWGGNKSEYKKTAAVFAEMGVASLRIDLRGHGESTNKGKLERGDVDPKLVFEAWPDIIAAHKFVKSHPKIDSTKIGFIGASYSGDLIAKSGRNYEFGTAYVILASGMFSSESMIWMRYSNADWLHIVAEDDHTFAPETVRLIKERDWAETIFYENGGHATAMLENLPELDSRLAQWFLEKFTN